MSERPAAAWPDRGGSADSPGSSDHLIEGRGRSIETPVDFAGDDGHADPRWVAAYTDAAEVEALLRSGVRLLVPIVAVRDEVDAATGADKSSHMASVSLVQADGRRGLLAFTGLESLARWDPAARPVPVTSHQVAAAAIDEGADGVLVDLAGPVRFAIDGDLLVDLARGVTPAG